MAADGSPALFATVGDNCVDRYLELGKCVIGGNALNVAIQLARAGASPALFHRVSPVRKLQRRYQLSGRPAIDSKSRNRV